MPTVSCPSCGRVLEVDVTHRDWTVRCPHCAIEFVPSEVDPAAFERDERSRRRRPSDESGDGYDRPARRWRDDPEFDERDRRAAEDAVHAPGLWLERCGWGSTLVMTAGAVSWLLMGAGARNNANDASAFVMAFLAGAITIPYAVVMVVGGRKMRTLSGYGWAMAASVLGIASIALFCFACVFVLVPVAFGIWGVVVLTNPIVARAFESPRDRSHDWND